MMVSVSFFVKAGDAGHLLPRASRRDEHQPVLPFHRGLEALRQVGSAGRPAASNERRVAKALPERRLVRRASPSALTVLYDQPAGAARVRNQIPSPGRIPDGGGTVPRLDGLALARVPSVNGSVPCLIRTDSSVPATVLVASGPCPRLGSRRGEAALHQTMAVVPERYGVGNRQPTRERGAEARAGRPSMPRVRRRGRRQPPTC